MNAGDTFYLRGPENERPHLWVVVSEPGMDWDHIVIVSMTTWAENRDQACVLSKDDHPNLTHQTCIDYARARTFSAKQIQGAVDLGALDFQQPVSTPILDQIRLGAIQSSFTPIKHRQRLIDQGLSES